MFAAILLVVLAVVHGSSAFTTGPNTHTLTTIAQTKRTTTDMPSYTAATSTTTSTSTSLNLKVKIDPDAKTKNASGNAKAAAYGGSIAVAALLPILFLVWSAVSKGH